MGVNPVAVMWLGPSSPGRVKFMAGIMNTGRVEKPELPPAASLLWRSCWNEPSENRLCRSVLHKGADVGQNTMKPPNRPGTAAGKYPLHINTRWLRSSDKLQNQAGRSSCSIDQCRSALFCGAVGATVNNFILFNTVPDNPAGAMGTARSKLLDRALEAVERIRFLGNLYLEGLVVIIAALITFGHGLSPSHMDRL